MRFVWAVVAFVLAAVLIGAGIAQRTIFMGPATQQTQVEIDEPAPFVLIDDDVLRANPGAQTLIVRGEGEIFGSYGRTADMEAWLADSDYNQVTMKKSGGLAVEHVTAKDPADTATDAPSDGSEGDTAAPESAGRDPRGSDLWLDSFAEDNRLTAENMQLPEGTSLLIAYDGTADAPDDIVVSWPLDNSTPWAGPLMVAGGIMLLLGLILYVLAIRHQRRGRGPRRKGPGPLPATEPIDVAVLPPAERAAIEESDSAAARPADPTVQTDGDVEDAEIVDENKDTDSKSSMRAAPVSRRRRMLALPVLGLTAILAAGCSSDSWPQLGDASPTPSPSPTVVAPENQKPPAVLEAQAKRILKTLAGTVSEADAALDLDLLSTRFEGPALASRTTEYALRAKLPDTAPPAAIPTDEVEVVLPEATDQWPRTVLMLSKTGDDSVPPVVLTMTQADPWSNYKVSNMAEMSADAVFPEVAASWLGTSMVPSDSAFLTIPPADLAATFADVVDQGEQSESYDKFDDLALRYAKSIVDSRQVVVQGLVDKGASETSQIAFDMTPTSDAPISMTTLDSGAIVAVTLTDTETVTPTGEDVSIRFGDNAQAKALTDATESAKGVETTYEFQLFFSVPAKGSTEQIRLLAAHQDLLSVKVIK
ncbi:glycosyl transferase [Microbacterium sp. NPDC058269]|uniref:glycosyl transferase n=1 Tax=Microbacterium sp. NPDC058269 TaxID=3346414 RepID=UPI0036D79D98